MQQIPQFIYFLLYLSFVVGNVFTVDDYILSKETISDANADMILIGEWKCNSDDECTAKQSTCKNNLCQCAPGYIFNANLTSCVKVATGMFDPCEETIQCSAYLLSGAKCIENVCSCGPGYYYLHGKCNRYFDLYKKCKYDIDCYVNADFEASNCDKNKGICTCSLGFYQREYRTCRREGKAINDECTIDIDCTFDNAVCNDEFVCVEKSKSDKSTESSSDKIMINSADEEIRKDINCTTDEDCSVLGNAICGLTGTCTCDRAYFLPETGTVCILELGESCQDGEVSYIKESFCREGRWSCTNGTVASKNNRECLKAATKYEGDCLYEEQCYVFGPDALCVENKCVCNENISHYVESELFCWGSKGFGETCRQDRDCYLQNFDGELICNETCVCPNDMHLNKNKTACINTSGLGELCEVDEDCATLNSVCNETKCVCAESYYPLNEQCLAGINSTCTVDEDCMPKFAECISDTCSCQPDYIPAAVNSCLPILSYGDICSIDLQCSMNLTDTICVPIEKNEKNNPKVTKSPITKGKIKVCSCIEGYYYKYGRCIKKRFLDEECTNLGECYESFNQGRIICKNNKCSCNWGYRKFNDSVCENGSVTNVVSTGLFLIILFVFSSRLF